MLSPPISTAQVTERMFELWCAADDDLLEGDPRYHMCNTGQGMQRVQSCPHASAVMQSVLRCEREGHARAFLSPPLCPVYERRVALC